MNFAITLVLTLAVFLTCIDSSSQFDCLPNGDPITGFLHSGTEKNADEPCSPGKNPPQAQQTLRFRSRSPPPRAPPKVRTPAQHKSQPPASSTLFPASAGFTSEPSRRFSTVMGYKLKDLPSIRLIPRTNQFERFELQRYTFPQGLPIEMKLPHNGRAPMPTEEQYVLVAANGDIVAILESHNILRGMYRTRDFFEYRVKINMYSLKIQDMTEVECQESPIGSTKRMSKHFGILDLKRNIII